MSYTERILSQEVLLLLGMYPMQEQQHVDSLRKDIHGSSEGEEGGGQG